MSIDTDDVATARTAPVARISSLGRPAELVLALIDQSQLRRECLKLAMAQHNTRWRVVDVGTAAEVLRMTSVGENFDLVLIAAATSEHVELGEIEALRKALPETPVVVTAESDNLVPSTLIEAAPARAPSTLGPISFADSSNELTRRQRDVLGLISQGKSNKLIADALTMSESTVKAHVKQIIKRLRVANRTQAALLATGVFARNAMTDLHSHPGRLSVGR